MNGLDLCPKYSPPCLSYESCPWDPLPFLAETDSELIEYGWSVHVILDDLSDLSL